MLNRLISAVFPVSSPSRTSDFAGGKPALSAHGRSQPSQHGLRAAPLQVERTEGAGAWGRAVLGWGVDPLARISMGGFNF